MGEFCIFVFVFVHLLSFQTHCKLDYITIIMPFVTLRSAVVAVVLLVAAAGLTVAF